jgi:hypothetical protein
MRKRALVLRKESLTELATDELSEVAGGSHTCVTHSILLTGCMCTGIYPSINVDCPATQLTQMLATVVCP